MTIPDYDQRDKWTVKPWEKNKVCEKNIKKVRAALNELVKAKFENDDELFDELLKRWHVTEDEGVLTMKLKKTSIE